MGLEDTDDLFDGRQRVMDGRLSHEGRSGRGIRGVSRREG